MKSLTTDVAAAALGIERRKLDNVLSREGRSLIGVGCRGRSRRIPMRVVEHVALALVLGRDLGMGVARALDLAGRILESPGSRVSVGSISMLECDVERLRVALELSVAEALESVAERTRGRPRT